jgi:hypothetical protein
VRSRYGYLHVPKAAGSSVMSALHAVAGERTVCRPTMDRTLFGSFDRFDELPEGRQAMVHTGADDDLARYDVVIGHFALSALHAGRQLSDIVMILREPRARLLSHYSYWRGWPTEAHEGWDPYVASRRAAELDWPEFLQDPSIAAQTDNVAARLLLGTDPRVPPDDFIDSADVDALVAEAVHRLGQLGHVDVIEHGDAVWRRLGTWLGHDLEVARRNETTDESGRPSDWTRWLTPASSLALGRRTEIDRELWAAAAVLHEPLGDAAVTALADAAYVKQVARVSVEQRRSMDAEPAPSMPLSGSSRRWQHSLRRRLRRAAPR